MTRRELLLVVLTAVVMGSVAWANMPPPSAPPAPPTAPPTFLPMPTQAAAPPAQRWDAFCINAATARVGQTWANRDLEKESGWNRVLRTYAAQGWEPYQLLTSGGASAGDNIEINAVCFRKQL